MEQKQKKSHEKKEKKKKPTEKEQITELTDSLQHLQAEFENYKKRIDKEKEDFIRYSKADMINKILPVLDSFEIALKNSKDSEKFLKGMEMIFAQLYSTVEAEGLRPIKADGQKFDPFKHEVLMSEETYQEEGIILEELQKGYMLNDRVLRHSKVKVSKKAAKEEKAERKKEKDKEKCEEKTSVPSESEAGRAK